MTNQTSPGPRGWWAAHGRTYLIVAALAAVAVLGLAAALGLHRVLDAGIHAFAVAIALPFVVAFVIIVACTILFLPLFLLALLLDGDMDIGGDFVASLVAKVVSGYFGFWAARRHPAFWGIVSGALVALGGLALIS